jgi:hypothetical protein
MKKNTGNTDRLIRLIIAAVLFALYATGTFSGAAAFLFLAVAFILVLTDAISFCLLFIPFGLNMLFRKLHIH